MNQHSGSERQINETQCRLAYNHLVVIGPLTAEYARNTYGIARLSARMKELRLQGHDIVTDMVQVKTRYGKRRIGQYRLVDANKQLVMDF